MTRPKVVALVVLLLLIAFGSGSGLWWVQAHRQPAASIDAAFIDAGSSTAPGPQVASRETQQPGQMLETPSAPAPAPAPSAPKTSMRPAPEPARQAQNPSFDIVRVEPRGDTVVAGKGAPHAKVALMAAGKVVAEVESDASGQFVILPPPLAPGDYDLTLRQQADGQPATDSAQSVAVSVPRPGKGSVVVALAEPGKATKLLSALPGAADRANGVTPMPQGKVAIRSAELENGNGFFVSGAAQPGAPVHVYLNDAHIADVVASKDGGWSVRVKKGLTGGHYVVRADVGDARVASRVEVPFDVPVAMAEAATGKHGSMTEAPKPPPDVVATASPTPDASPSVAGTAGPDATVDSIATARVINGDNLWNISRYRLGDGKRFTQIYAANVGQIRDPNLIYPGQVFVVPRR